ncbi:MAG: hypothetical protein K8R86_02915 [Bacteroidales bacterium]|nr:hypothetical protein [Bacteroidales bacterium]
MNLPAGSPAEGWQAGGYVSYLQAVKTSIIIPIIYLHSPNILYMLPNSHIPSQNLKLGQGYGKEAGVV